MQLLAQTAEAIAATSKKNEKVRLLAEFFKSRTVEEAAVAALFFSGRPFPAFEDATLQVGGRLLWTVVAQLSGQTENALGAAYRKHGDLGAATYEVLSRSGDSRRERLSLLQALNGFRRIAEARSAAAKTALLRDLLTEARPLEAKYLIKIMTGELRIGLKESLVEEAIAAAYGDPVREVQRANMLLGDIGETLRLAANHRLSDAHMRLFHPIGFMLASPVDSAAEAFQSFQHAQIPAQIEDKYDGIRAQVHASGGQVRIFSRTLDDITESFPELIAPLAIFTEDVILDGEILAWDFATQPGAAGRALPFSKLQARLGRKRPTAKIMETVPVAYVVFDVLYAGGELVIDRRLHERSGILNRLFEKVGEVPVRHRQKLAAQDAQGTLQFEPAISVQHPPMPQSVEPERIVRAPVLRADSAEQISEFFDLAQARGNEGLMIKDVNSVYTPGRRGGSWIKLKRELATLDVVVTAVERGHGKRIGVLSDYTFAVRGAISAGYDDADLPTTPAGDPLLNVGKAYSGLTDVEIAEMTAWFEQHTISDSGWLRQVEPKIVIEVAFNAVMRSDRHSSGYALRFPRIMRLRRDKSPEEADTLDRVREIYERQKWPEAA
jgi:ATP-dependent DNA ligase I